MPVNRLQKEEPLHDVFLKGILVNNPVLVQVIGICPVVAAAVSLRAAALLAGVYSLVLIITELIASAFLKKTIRWVRVAIYLLIGLAVISPFSYYLEKNDAGIRITVGIYLALLAANSLAVLRCEKIAVKNSVRHTFFDSLAASIGYSTVFIVVGFVRELIGNATILEKPVRFLPKASGMLMPFGGFIVMGFLAAALRWLIIRHYPQYAKAMVLQITSTPVTMKLPKEDDDFIDEMVDDAMEEAPVTAAESTPVAGTARSAENIAPLTDDNPGSENTTDVPDNPVPVAETAEDSATQQGIYVKPLPEPVPQSVQESPQEKALGTPAPQLQPKVMTDCPDSMEIDLRFKELLHFLEACDATSENKGFAENET